jgi:hypothetical protein
LIPFTPLAQMPWRATTAHRAAKMVEAFICAEDVFLLSQNAKGISEWMNFVTVTPDFKIHF